MTPNELPRHLPFAALLGETIASITGAVPNSEQVEIVTASGRRFEMYHWQDCCESVVVNDVAGDVADLLGGVVVIAEEGSNDERPADLPPLEYTPDSQTWTFYRIAAGRGTVVIRWLGESNGYYSEEVSFREVRP